MLKGKEVLKEPKGLREPLVLKEVKDLEDLRVM